jgi:putative endonuclease
LAKHNHTGKTGESLAKTYFEQKGYHVLHCNWRHRHWEVDLVASLAGILHFIEVKTRTNKNFGYPEENVSPKKIQYLLNAADEYLYQNPDWKRIQFDILAITMLPGEAVEYFLIEDVYV